MRWTILTLLFPILVLGACSSRLVIVDRDSRSTPPHGPAGEVAALKIPPGHFPPPGMCRVWFPGRPPGHQPPAASCRSAHEEVPVGAWVIHRSTKRKKSIEVTAYHRVEPDVVLWVKYFDAKTGEAIR